MNVTTIGGQSSITRRSLILLGWSSLLTVPLQAAATGRPIRERTLSMDVVHTGERLKRVYWSEDRYIQQALHEFHYLLRDHRTDEVRAIDVKLLDLLYDIHILTDSHTSFEIVSGYRSPATNRQLHRTNPDVARHSYHTQGMAIDIRLPDRNLSQLKAIALRLSRGGVGYYPNAAFLHVDVGPCRQW